VLAGELGAGLGHAVPLSAMADRLVAGASARGVELRCILALRDGVFARKGLQGGAHRVVLAPRLDRPIAIVAHTGSHAEQLARAGFANDDMLGGLLAAWDDLFALLGADHLLANHSPSAILAARGTIPVTAIGNGFTLPPANLATYPPLRARTAASFSEPLILKTVNTVLERRGTPPLPALPAILDCGIRGLFSLPHLDPYHGVRAEPALGPYGRDLVPRQIEGRPRILYVAPSDALGIEAVGAAIADRNLPFSVALDGPPSTSINFLRIRGAELLDPGDDLAPAIAAASVVVAHGAANAVQIALAIGRPILVVSTGLETQLLAGQIEVMGAGLGARSDDREAFEEALEAVLNERRFRESAQGIAHGIQGLDLPDDPLEVIARRVLDLVCA
jgi:UDP:flavonoid glycosyltransferase YjiC (YdhE family)